ncbi:MAG: SDR family oxidoreductase [Patescibacteria group bacterium]
MAKAITLITGASSGIGRELSFVFAEHKQDLLLVARSGAELSKLAEELALKHGITALYLAGDLREMKSVEAVKAYCVAHDLFVENLVNNAGFGDFGPFADSKIERQLGMINLNISALVYLTHLFLPAMIEKGKGRILNVASTAAFQPGPLMSVYYATKAFVLHFSEAIANELKTKNISVTALCPGPTASNFKAVANLDGSRLMKNRKLPTARSVAEDGYRALMAGKIVAISGWKNAFMAFLVRFFPRRLVLKIVRKFQENF